MLLSLLLAVIIVASSLYVAITITHGQTPFGWRTTAGLVAWVIGSCSAVLFLVTVIYAHRIGGFPYYDPLLASIYRYGCLSAFVGLAVGVAGIGRVRVAVVVLSGTMLTLWLICATSE